MCGDDEDVTESRFSSIQFSISNLEGEIYRYVYTIHILRFQSGSR